MLPVCLAQNGIFSTSLRTLGGLFVCLFSSMKNIIGTLVRILLNRETLSAIWLLSINNSLDLWALGGLSIL